MFSDGSKSPVTFTDPSQFQSFTSNGAIEAANATQFITGQISTVALSFGYSVKGSTSSPPAPVLTYMLTGVQQKATLTQSDQTFSVDIGTSWSITNPLPSSTLTERWQTNQASTGAATSPQTIDFVFFHQYLVTFGFNVVGGGSNYSPPAATCQEFGNQISPTMGTQIWVDAAQYSFPNLLTGSSSSERWQTNVSVTGNIGSSATIDIPYTHQYYVMIILNPTTGGSISAASSWYDAGAAFQSEATSNAGWQFESWSGTGQGSYSGDNSGALANVDSPLTETAIFYPGLTITASGKVAVSYTYNAVVSLIPSSTQKTIYEPAGAEIQLSAKPSLFIYTFSGWTGSAISDKSSIPIVLDTPQNITANFSYNYVVIGIAVGVVIAIIAAAIILAAHRKKKPPVIASH